MTAFINQAGCQCIVASHHIHVNILKTSKHLIKLLSNNSLHKLENKFYMRPGNQKLRYNLEWPNSGCAVQGYLDTDVVLTVG